MKRIRRLLEDNRIYVAIVVIILVAFDAMLIYGASIKQFWYDEMATIGFMRSDISFSQMVDYYLNIEASNLPLYQIIFWVFYRMLPPEMVYVLLPSIILTTLGVIMMTILADRMYGRYAAYVVLLLNVVSGTTVNKIGLLCRSYSLMFFGASFTLLFMYEVGKKNNLKNNIILTVALICLVYSHYFGTLLFGILSILIFINIVVKKDKLVKLVPYVIAGGLFIPWFLLAMKTRVQSVNNFWIEPPRITKPLETIGYLLGSNIVACLVWGICFIVMAVLIIRRKEIFDMKSIVTFMPVLVIGLIFVYSHVGGSLYEDRYFIILLPELVLTIGGFCQEVADIKEIKGYKILLPIVTVALLLITIITSMSKAWYGLVVQYDRYNLTADYILNEGDISNDDTLLVIRDFEDVDSVAALGWYDFYLKRRGHNATNLVVRTSGDNDQTTIIDSYEGELKKVYVFAPLDLTGYYGEGYNMVFQDYLMRLTVYERVE